MPGGRKPKGDKPINVVVSTKVTREDCDFLISAYGSAYAGLQAAIQALKEKS